MISTTHRRFLLWGGLPVGVILLVVFGIWAYEGLTLQEAIAKTFQNIFVRTIVLPIGFAVVVGLLEYLTDLTRGRSKGQFKYRVWEAIKEDSKEAAPAEQSKDRALIPSAVQRARSHADYSLSEIFKDYKDKYDNVLEVQQMPGLGVTHFCGVGLDLAVAAVSLDIAFLITRASAAAGEVTDKQAEMAIIDGTLAFVMLLHFVVLIGVMLFTMLQKAASPLEEAAKKNWSIASIALGIFSMIISFLIVYK